MTTHLHLIDQLALNMVCGRQYINSNRLTGEIND